MKILSIGNSFSVDTMEHLADVALDLGAEKVKMANLYFGGCSINQHWDKAKKDLAEYEYYVNEGKGWNSKSCVSIRTAVTEEHWDWISIQHGTGDGGFYTRIESYDNLAPLIEYVKELAGEDTKIAFNMTWVGEPTRIHHEIQYYNGNQLLIFEKIAELTKNVIANVKGGRYDFTDRSCHTKCAHFPNSDIDEGWFSFILGCGKIYCGSDIFESTDRNGCR